MVSPSTTNTLLARPLSTVNEREHNPGTNRQSPRWGLAWIGKGRLIVGTPWKVDFDLLVDWEYRETAFIAQIRGLDDYGVGTSTDEAIQDLLFSIADFRESLERRVAANASLSDELRRTLQFLQQLLVRNE